MATAYVAVDPQDAENGALTVLNGSHALGRLDHWTKGDQQGADLERVALARERYAELRLNLAPGDVVFFDALLLHTSPGNFSPRRRAALGFAFTRSDNEQFRKEAALISSTPVALDGLAQQCGSALLWSKPKRKSAVNLSA